MGIPHAPLEAILRDAGIDPEKKLKTGCTAFGYLEACVMGALDEIEEDPAPEEPDDDNGTD